MKYTRYADIWYIISYTRYEDINVGTQETWGNKGNMITPKESNNSLVTAPKEKNI